MSKQAKPEFRHGYIFGNKSELVKARSERNDLGFNLRAYRRKDEVEEIDWEYWDRSLHKYAYLEGFNFRTWFWQKLEAARAEGRVLRVLDVGIGSARQWQKLAGHPNLELWGTSLSRNVVSSLRKRVRSCHAGALHKKFEPGYFDIAVSHMGLHGMEYSGIENMLWVLKKGGETIVSGDPTGTALKKADLVAPDHFDILAYNEGDPWSFHLKKK